MRKKVITNRLSSKFLAIFVVGLILSVQVLGQNVRNTDYKADQALKSNARVNPSTLAMELSIPIGGYAGRAGNGLPVMFDYSSKVWQVNYLYSWESWNGVKSDTKPMYGKRTAAGWTSNLGVPRIDYQMDIYDGFHEGSLYEGQIHSDYVPIEPNPNPPNYALFYVKRVQVQMPGGSTHEFRVNDTANLCGSSQSGCVMDLTGTFLSVDGSKMRLELAESASTLYLADGSRYLFGAKTAEHLANAFVDRNGNRMDYDAANRRWTDTLGRIINDPMPMNWGDFQQTQTVGDQTGSFPSLNGGTMNVMFSWRYLKDPNGGESGLEDTSQPLNNLSNVGCQGNVTRQLTGAYLFGNPDPSITRVCHPISWVGLDWTQGPPFNPVVLTKITLPNGQKYEFKYNVYGEIEKIIYPTGGYERFLYGYVPALQFTESSYDQANRGVWERWVSAKGDGTDELHWMYQSIGKVITTAPDNTKTEQYIIGDSLGGQNPYGFGDAKTGRSYEDRVLSPTNQLLRRKLTGYEITGAQTGGYSAATRDLRPNKEVTIIFEPGASYALASMTETVYDTHSDPQYFASLNPKQTKIYNYIVLDLATAQTANINQIAALFTSSNLATVTEIDYLYDANYKARNLVSLPIATRIKDASGNTKAQSEISYDEVGSYPIIQAGTNPQWQDPNTNYRGNPTTTKSWTDIANNQSIQTHAQYDNFGNVRKTWDGRGNLGETEYSPTYNYAYPTKVTTPIPDTSGVNGSNTAFETTSVYDFNTGLPTSLTDANGQITTIEYNDALLRPTKVIAPNGQQTITEYGAGTSEATRFVKSRTQIDAEKWKEGYSWYDGLGRTIKSQSVDSNGDVFVETEYDNMGRAKKATNPFRTGETKLWTESFYDDLSRVVKTKTPDLAEVSTSYSLATSGSQVGTTVTVTDQAGKQRRSIINALGQLKRVDEPNEANQLGVIDSPNQSTSYVYDILNNLTAVNQGTQARSFVYDSLSRLKQATNPESGIINYSYDLNGNLTQKIDARSVQTNFAYDNLNRVKTRSYSNEPTGQTPTPTVSYYYDGIYYNAQSQPQQATGSVKGKLTSVSSIVSRTNYTSFDIMGRVTANQQITDDVAYNPMTYVYNLSGALIEETYPSGRVVKNVLDNDGDLSIVQSKKNQNAGFFNYAKNFTYTSAGAVSSMQLGNGRWESTSFNSRLQPTQIALGTVQNGTDKLKLNYDYGQTQNNGNVLSQQITVPTVGTNQGFAATQNYTYDSLNRLKSATENIDGNPTPSWKQTFVFDRYGNRNFDTANTTTLGSCPTAQCNPTIDAANNRFTSGQGYTYDLAGNVITNAQGRTFIYDAENKQKEVKDASNVSIGTYLYDGDGKRVKKISAMETVIFVYDAGGKLIAEYSNQTPQNPQVSYLTNDHLGSPRILTDANGNVISRRDFMPFGEEVFTTQRTQGLGYTADNIRQKFATYERDNETDLDFAQARYYAKNHGRFNSVDPIMMEKKRLADPQAINLYVYTRNNPLKYVDPDGEKFKGTDGKEVIIKREKVNGKKVWVIKSNNASKDLQKLVGLINNSGSRTASNQFNKLNNHATMINLVIDSTTSRSQEEINTGSTTIGLHQPHDKNGPLTFNDKTDKFDGKAESAVDDKGNVIKGAYQEATITLFEKKMEELGYSGDALDGKLVAVFGHETRHDLDPIQVQAGVTGTGSDAIWHPEKNGKPRRESPDYFGDKIKRQIERRKGIKID